MSKWKTLTRANWNKIIGKTEDNGYYEKIVNWLKKKNTTGKHSYQIPTKKEWLNYLFKLDSKNIKYTFFGYPKPFYWQDRGIIKVSIVGNTVSITGVKSS